ncbi:MAG: glycoside hydrolase family 20 zincin-like fold domain-containing protein [Candidatus Sumerlaeaceae bacterium]
MILGFCTSVVAQPRTIESLMLVPMPREVQWLPGKMRLNNVQWRVKFETGDPKDEEAVQIVASEFPELKLDGSARTHGPLFDLVLTTGPLTADAPPLFLDQGYRLTIERRRVLIQGPSAMGRFYGLQTFRQLIVAYGGKELPCLTIMDYPDLGLRGVSDDISRGQVSTVEDFHAIIRQLAFYKKNLYQPYIEDMFQFETDPNIGADRGAITKTEMAAMVEEGKRHHVLVAPVFETLGHQDRLLSLPENRKYAELQGEEDKPWSFSPVNPEAFEFVTRLVDELVDATPNAPFFHIAGDESWDVGKGTSKARVQEIGVGKLHAEYFTRLHDHLTSRGRKMLLYGDMLLNHPDSLEVLPKDCTIVDWHYNPRGPFPSVKKLRDMGFNWIITSPGLWSWSTFYPNYRSGFSNIAELTAAGRAHGAIGSITSSWGDNGAENLRENNMTGFAYSAATEWETTAPSRDSFLRRYVVQQYGREAPPVLAAETFLGWALPEGIGNWNALLHQNIRIKVARADLVTSMQKLLTQAERVQKDLASYNARSLYNEEHIAVLAHCLKRVHYLASRIVTLDEIARTLQKQRSGELPGETQVRMQLQLAGLRDELTDITGEYTGLWLRRNKYPKLDDNLTRLQNQIAQLQGFLVELQAGELANYPPMKGVWFWYPEPDPQQASTTSTKYFVRELELASDPMKAQLRLFCDDNGRAFINGRSAADANFGTGSADKDVNVQLKKGRNFIAVQASNEWGAAGVLFSLVIRLRDGSTIELTGDDQWRTMDLKQETAAWRNQPPVGDDWKPVKLLGAAPVKPWNDID